ncbi:MAG: hypothetical protein M1827_002589 [Pycnora praestabilis]|nr:MAG: hypothetical protein M1827_002589 [Pycnora praestabilis]
MHYIGHAASSILCYFSFLGMGTVKAGPIVKALDLRSTNTLLGPSTLARRTLDYSACNGKPLPVNVPYLVSELAMVTEILNLVKPLISKSNYYITNFIPVDDQEIYADDLQDSYYGGILDLPADADFAVHYTCDDTTDQCKKNLGGLMTTQTLKKQQSISVINSSIYPPLLACKRIVQAISFWITMIQEVSTDQFASKGKGSNSFRYEAITLIHEVFHMDYLPSTPWAVDWAWGAKKCSELSKGDNKEEAKINPDTAALIASGLADISDGDWERGSHLPLEYDCFCSEDDYDGGDFFGFPSKKGWVVDIDSMHRMDASPSIDRSSLLLLPKDIINEAKAFLQAWLFFGTLAEVSQMTEVALRPQDFVREEVDGHRFLTFALLRRYVGDWADMQFKKGCCYEADRLAKVENMLKTIASVLEGFAGVVLGPDYLAVANLIQLIRKAASIIWGMPKWKDLPVQECAAAFRNACIVPPLDHPSLRARGWCPSEIDRLSHGFLRNEDPQIVYYTGTLRRHRQQAYHDGCSATICLRENVNEKQYRQVHTEACSSCSTISLQSDQVDKVISILQMGGLPRIAIHSHASEGDPRSENITLEVIARGSQIGSDGLGNTETNGLPTCQLRRLDSLVKSIQKPPGHENSSLIWIDTLCVPVNRYGRKLALGQLGRVYKDAKEVLVLDYELQHTSLDISREEILLRILFSRWLTRLWTLEEGVLGRSKLYFQFEDGTFRLPITQPRNLLYVRDYTENLEDAIFDRLPPQSFFSVGDTDLAGHSDIKTSLLPKIASLLISISDRRTTKAADEPLCVASILSLSLLPIAAQDGLESHKYMSIDVYRQRMNVHPLIIPAWAGHIGEEYSCTIIPGEGLLCTIEKAYLVLFEESTRPEIEGFWMHGQGAEQADQLWTPYTSQKTGHCDLDRHEVRLLGYAFLPMGELNAALLLIDRKVENPITRGTTYFCTLLSRMHILHDDDLDRLPVPPDRTTRTRIVAEVVSQEWCIG